MKNLTMKRVLAGVLGAATMIASSLTMASACTTIYAGANRAQEGTKFIARSEDYGSDMNKLWFVSEAGAYSGTFRGCPEYGPFTYELSHPSYRFTYFKNDNVYNGVCPECGEENAQHASYTEFGTNEKGVSVSATETISGTDAVLAVDPYRDAGWAQENSKPAGIEEGDIPTVLLSEAASAREALDLLLSIYATYGCADGAGLFITDQQESWYIENCSGTQYVAIKLNDDLLFLEPNMAIIGSVDLDDTENVIASPKLIETAKAAGTFTGDAVENIINFRASYAGRLDSADKRLVEGLNYLNSAYSYDADQLVADNSRFTISNLDASGAIVPLYTNVSADRTLSVDDILNYYKLSTIAKSGNLPDLQGPPHGICNRRLGGRGRSCLQRLRAVLPDADRRHVRGLSGGHARGPIYDRKAHGRPLLPLFQALLQPGDRRGHHDRRLPHSARGLGEIILLEL